jgi:hypothetical protein
MHVSITGTVRIITDGWARDLGVYIFYVLGNENKK